MIIPQVVDLDFEEFKRTWQLYINAFAEALIAQGADNIETPAGQRVVSHDTVSCMRTPTNVTDCTSQPFSVTL